MTFSLSFRHLSSSVQYLLAIGVLLCLFAGPVSAQQPPSAAAADNQQVLQTFLAKDMQSQPVATATSDQNRRWVMFVLGAPLLILLLITGGLGIAMGIYGKQVYLAHMICAGLSISLALAHAVVGLIWFRPF
jgi:hypothetical protein